MGRRHRRQAGDRRSAHRAPRGCATPTDYIDKRLDGVVGLRFAVERLEGVFKLSQNQSDPNRDGVIAGLEAAADPASAALARRMRERPA